MDVIQIEHKLPQIPQKWDYDKSVQRVKGLIYKWKNLTEEIIGELWIAREILRSQGARTDLTSEQKFQSWDRYCQDISSSRQVYNTERFANIRL